MSAKAFLTYDHGTTKVFDFEHFVNSYDPLNILNLTGWQAKIVVKDKSVNGAVLATFDSAIDTTALIVGTVDGIVRWSLQPTSFPNLKIAPGANHLCYYELEIFDNTHYYRSFAGQLEIIR